MLSCNLLLCTSQDLMWGAITTVILVLLVYLVWCYQYSNDVIGIVGMVLLVQLVWYYQYSYDVIGILGMVLLVQFEQWNGIIGTIQWYMVGNKNCPLYVPSHVHTTDQNSSMQTGKCPKNSTIPKQYTSSNYLGCPSRF